MTRKLLMIGIALVGLTLALGGNAWAENGRGGKDRRNGNAYHQNDKTPPGHHYGWEKGKGNPHKANAQYRQQYRHRDRYQRDYHHHRPIVEKHVYHHTSSDERYDDDRFNVAVSVIDQVFSVAVVVSGSR